MAALPALVLLAALVAACGGDGSGASSASSAGGAMVLEVRWRYAEGFPGRITIHEPLPGHIAGQTFSYAEGDAPALGDEIAGGLLRTSFGEMRGFVALYRNPTDEPVRFWVAPHLPLPYSAEAGLLVRCLCTGVQYEVPPRGTWMRVMELGLNRRAGGAGPVSVTHVVVRGEVPVPGSSLE